MLERSCFTRSAACAAVVIFAAIATTCSGQSWPLNSLATLPVVNGTSQDPVGPLVRDASGNLYGTTYSGGTNGFGSVFELKNSSGSYALITLYSFSFGDGAYPMAGLLMDSSGNLYGTTRSGGNFGSGTIFELRYSSGAYTYTTLYGFGGSNTDPQSPNSTLVMDARGDLFGTTQNGGAGDISGTIFELPSAGGGSYAGFSLWISIRRHGLMTPARFSIHARS